LSFVEAAEEFEALGVQLLSMSVDSFASCNAFGVSLGAEFPMLGDWPLYEVSRAYGVYDEEKHTARRVTFVLDEDHVVRAVIDEPRDIERHSRDALALFKSRAGEQAVSSDGGA
jgi:alkyl hydroperoxide reductase subunit AhpC